MPEEIATPEVDEATPTHEGTDLGGTSKEPSLEQEVRELKKQLEQANQRYVESRRGADMQAQELSQLKQQVQAGWTQTANQPQQQLDANGMTPEEAKEYAGLDDIVDARKMRQYEMRGLQRLRQQDQAATLYYSAVLSNQMMQTAQRQSSVAGIPHDSTVHALALEYQQTSPLFQSQNDSDYVVRDGQKIHREALILADQTVKKHAKDQVTKKREDPFASGSSGRDAKPKFDARTHLSGEERDAVSKMNAGSKTQITYEDYFNNLSSEERRRRMSG